MTEHFHHVTVTISSGGPACAHFSCTAPAGSSCRQTCSRECDCDYTSEACLQDGHDMVDYDWGPGECNITTWLNESGTWDESYDGLETEVRSGLIVATWEGEYYTWEYAKPAEAVVSGERQRRELNFVIGPEIEERK